MVENARPALLVLLEAVGLVLLITCTNVANLLLANSAGANKNSPFVALSAQAGSASFANCLGVQETLTDAAKSGATRGTSKMRTGLVVTQVAVAVLLLVGAGLRNQILGLTLGYTLRLTGIGLIIGMVAAFVLTRYVNAFLFQVPSYDLVTLDGTAIVIVLVAIAASYVPARRATSIDPAKALRQN